LFLKNTQYTITTIKIINKIPPIIPPIIPPVFDLEGDVFVLLFSLLFMKFALNGAELED
jgi:hypothetical protein